MIRVALSLVVSLTLALPAVAGHCVVQVPSATVSTISGAVTITPFAVPVAVPVTTVAPSTVGYSYSAAAAQYQGAQTATFRTAEDDLIDRLAARLIDKLGLGPKASSTAHVTQHCGRCHTGDGAKGSFRVDQPLGESDRLRAIEAVLADDDAVRMPKGSTLAPEALGPLIQELARRPAATTVEATEAKPTPAK